MTDPQLSGPGTLDAIAPLRLPAPGKLFARRAARFDALAPGNTLGEYLALLARLSRAQAGAWAGLSTSLLPPPAQAGGGPGRGDVSVPLDAAGHRRDPAWRAVLAGIIGELSRADLPAETRGALELLAALPPPEVEAIADRVLANAVAGSDLASGPFVAAALQVYFTALASRLDAATLAPGREACPACGSQPVAGVVLPEDKVRYLVCSLCATQWHHTRVECTVCQSGEAVSYYALDAGALAKGSVAAAAAAHSPTRSAARAEACAKCKAYTKLFYLEADTQMEPFADDVATLSLDLLMAEDGWARNGVNLFLLPGEAKAPMAS
jgi:FdhE protein